MAPVNSPFVEWVRVENYRCIKSVDLHLTRLHALIGPNDSGKSSLLRAILGGTCKFWIPGVGGISHHVSMPWNQQPYPSWDGTRQAPDAPIQTILNTATAGRALLRLDPDAMRAPAGLITQGESLWFSHEKGTGLPALYDALLSRDIGAFSKINDRFVSLFPTVGALRLHNASPSQKQLGLTLLDGTIVGPAEMSEGMLYWLAFAVIEHLARYAIVLIEEPENGLHPARIAEVMRVLREVSQRTQIVIATHSPLVINELRPDEVTIVTRSRAEGTICTPIRDTKNFETRSKTYALGELWVSYADGNLEEGLVPQPPPPV